MIIAAIMLVLYLGLIVLMIASGWKLFTKAGQPGWASIIPIYNAYVMTVEIAKKEILWFILLFIPFVNFVAAILICIEVAKKFGKSDLYGVGLAFLGFIFFPMLAFGDAQYQGGGKKSLGEDDGEKNW